MDQSQVLARELNGQSGSFTVFVRLHYEFSLNETVWTEEEYEGHELSCSAPSFFNPLRDRQPMDYDRWSSEKQLEWLLSQPLLRTAAHFAWKAIMLIFEKDQACFRITMKKPQEYPQT